MEWIAVKNNLPTDENNHGDQLNCVLVFSSFNNSIAFARYLYDHWRLDSKGVYSDVGNICEVEEKDITHWMPLPRFPRKDK